MAGRRELAFSPLPYVNQRRLLGLLAGQPRIQPGMQQVLVIRGKGQSILPHGQMIVLVPVRLHDSSCRMPADSLQDVGDLVDRHIRQQRRKLGAFDALPRPVVEHHNVGSFKGKSVGQRAGMLRSWGMFFKGDFNHARGGRAGSDGVPVDSHPNAGEYPVGRRR